MLQPELQRLRLDPASGGDYVLRVRWSLWRALGFMQRCLAGFEAGAHSWSDGISFPQRCLFVTFSRAKIKMLKDKRHPVSVQKTSGGGKGALFLQVMRATDCTSIIPSVIRITLCRASVNSGGPNRKLIYEVLPVWWLPSMQPQRKQPDTARADYKPGRWFPLRGSRVFAFPPLSRGRAGECSGSLMHTHTHSPYTPVCVIAHAFAPAHHTRVSVIHTDILSVFDGTIKNNSCEEEGRMQIWSLGYFITVEFANQWGLNINLKDEPGQTRPMIHFAIELALHVRLDPFKMLYKSRLDLYTLWVEL